ncbi:MAG TPA: helix-turn-helix transcriptional regulator [Coleofasciculaceae cyanobacterium]|jgi:transcriptional regulator with XRE-family HTH domain
MGRAGKALKQVLETYHITQNRLAVTMGIDRSNVSRWVSEERDPTGEAIAEIKIALEKLEPEAADEFIRLFLYRNLGEMEE